MDEELPPSPGTATHTPPEADEIARLAYQFYEEEGRPEGRAEEHWRRAEQTLLGIAPPLGPSNPTQATPESGTECFAQRRKDAKI